jgi:predicted membrane protein
MIDSLTAGACLIIVGFFFLIKAFFGLHIPVFRILFGVAFVYFGIMLITNIHISHFSQQTGRSTTHFTKIFPPADNPEQENVCFSSVMSSPTDLLKNEYSTIFGKLVLNLHNVANETFSKPLKLHTVFGSTRLVLPKERSARIIIKCSCGSATYPGGSHSAFGTKEISIRGTSEQPPIIIHADVVFGTLTIV